MIKKKIVKTAKGFLGQEEIRGNLGFKDEQFQKMMEAVGWQKNQAWCAYFVELVWKLCYAQNQQLVQYLNKKFSASAVQTWKNFQDTQFETNKIPDFGALVVWQRYKKGKSTWQGHIGIVSQLHEEQNSFKSIEGNTNDDGSREGYEVAEKKRTLNFENKNGLRLLGFIHPKEINNDES
jgi:hypothetical protein